MLNRETFKNYLGSILSNFGEVDYSGYNYITFQSGPYKMDIFFKEVVFRDKKIILNVRTGDTVYCKNKNKERIVRYGHFLTYEIGILKDDKIYITSGLLEPAKEVMDIIHSLEVNKVKKELQG
jgi:hypothetical protein